MNQPRLQSLIFEVTQRCSHRCLHCYNIWHNTQSDCESAPPNSDDELSTTQTLALLADVLDETRCFHVTLTGGEPLMRQDLPVILDFLREQGVMTTVISNGRLLSASATAELLARGVGLFELPLLSDKRETHDYLSGSPGAFDAVLAAMSHIRYQGGRFVAVFVATRLNLSDLTGVIRLAVAFGARGLMLNRFNPGGRGQAHLLELLPTVDQLRELLAIADAAALEYGIPITCTIPIQPCLIDVDAYPNLGFGFCAAGTERAYFTLDPWGYLRPCNHSSLVLGNLRHEHFADLISSDRFTSFVEAAPEFCDGCALRDICQGGCKAAAAACYSSPYKEEPFLKHNRALARRITKCVR